MNAPRKCIPSATTLREGCTVRSDTNEPDGIVKAWAAKKEKRSTKKTLSRRRKPLCRGRSPRARSAGLRSPRGGGPPGDVEERGVPRRQPRGRAEPRSRRTPAGEINARALGQLDDQATRASSEGEEQKQRSRRRQPLCPLGGRGAGSAERPPPEGATRERGALSSRRRDPRA